MPSRTTWKILVPTFAVSGLLLIVGVGGAVFVHRANRAVSDSLDRNLAAAQSAQRLVLAVRELRLRLVHFASTGDISHLDAARSWLRQVEDELNRRGPYLPGSSVSGLHSNDFRDRFDQLASQPAGETRQEIVADLISLSHTTMLAPAERLLKERQQLVTETSRKNQVVARRIGLGLLLLGVCGAGAGLLIGFNIARGVHRSMVEISVPVRDMAGRLNEVVGPIQVSADTDFSQLDGSLRMLADKTADVVRQLQENQRQTLRHEQLAAVGQLAAGLAHELRNPLMSVKLIVQTAAERADRAFNAQDLAVIEDEVTRLENLLQSFLDFARPPQPKKEAADMCQVIEKTLEVVRPRASQQDVQLHFSVSGNPELVEADESQLRQVVLNLLLNALDVLPNGGNVWLQVSSNEKPVSQLRTDVSIDNVFTASNALDRHQGARLLQIRVADDGPGLPAEVADKIFEPFVSTRDTGIGLGLSICRQIVESHDGKIFAANRPSGGAEFTMLLPACPRVPASVPSQGATYRPVSAGQ